MDIHVRNVPAQATRKQFEAQLQGPLNNCGIYVYFAEKRLGNPYGFVTVPDVASGQRFLAQYGNIFTPGSPPNAKPKLRWGPSLVQFTKGRNEPSDFVLQSLAYEASQRAKAARKGEKHQKAVVTKSANRFDTLTLENGAWDFADDRGKSSQLVFVTHFTDTRQGQLILGPKQAVIVLGAKGTDQCRIDLYYHDCLDINLGTFEEPSVTFGMKFAPKMYQIKAQDQIALDMAALALGGRPSRAQLPKNVRLPAISHAHSRVAGTCFAYRVVLADSRLLSQIRAILQRTSKCTIKSLKTSLRYPERSLEDSFTRLNYDLSNQTGFGRTPIQIRYQVDRLAKNGILSPATVLKLLPKISKVYAKYGVEATVHGLKRFARDVNAEPPGPSVDARIYTQRALEELLDQHANSWEDSHMPDNPFELAKRHTHIELVRKIVVTPAGIYLEGPEPEPTNRVLRHYAASADNFIRVIFQDEDGGTIRYDPRADNSEIYHQRFKKVLNESVLTCGQGFSFLGFSHSSLRSSSCWLMAPMVSKQGKFLFADFVIKELGDFSHIRVPAKCAARIGQNFTDTNATVKLEQSQIGELPVISRNGRDFSDGVGTISYGLLQRVWRVYGTKKLLKPTALQIRFQGYKGMVSLDSTLPGQCLMLRENMKKYHTAATWHLEICGAAFRPMPMVLNRPFIKIFEDLGIPLKVFVDLQSSAMADLRTMTESSTNTATLIDHAEGVKATRVPQLIRYLGELGLDYHQDSFLYQVVEMVVVSKVRDLKYCGRYPVEKGVTLYGIMDETGYLKEGEIFVVTERAPEGGRQVLVKDRVVVTRSPALHPGDVQVARAIDVPDSSPLNRLSNVVVFSQHGSRDLPSQLSGGDLDGDLYNIIWDPALVPDKTYPAADYPRVEAAQLDRAVTRQDMSDFFVTFMESDLLGMISSRHLQLADQRDLGVFDPDCITLAGLASTAVDFSKTGIPVTMKQAPEPDRCKPDFMAPSPRVVILDSGEVNFEEDDVDDDTIEGIDTELRPVRYYASQKALGHLYRGIDEHQFLQHMQRDHQFKVNSSAADGILNQVLQYVLRYVEQYGIMYTHHRSLAADIQASYDDSLVDILYEYEPSPRSPLSETEVFAGQILGRQGGAQGKPLRELSKTMRERFENIVEYNIMRMTKGDQLMKDVRNSGGDLDDLYDDTLYDDREFEALPRAVACLEVSVSNPGRRDPMVGELRSFRYVAAAVCLKELERYRITTFGSYTLPSFDEWCGSACKGSALGRRWAWQKPNETTTTAWS